MIFSYDIFDTLIQRKCGTPHDLFCEVERKQDIINDFAYLRIKAERICRQLSRTGEVTFDEIYEIFMRMTGMSSEDAGRLRQLEMEEEIEEAEGIKENINGLKERLCRNERVILISDMYLSEAEINAILESVDRDLAEVKKYISSEYKRTKNSGSLYIEVKKQEKCDFDEWEHVGDNIISDVRVPEFLGITARQYIRSMTDERENKKDLYTAYMMNIQDSQSIGRLNSAKKTGLCAGAPLLLPYIAWILSICEIKGIRRLYFLSRDGFILKIICDKILAQGNGNSRIDTYYIYASREAIYDYSQNARQDRIGYFSENVDMSDPDFAFVDLQGTGDSVSILSRELNTKIKTFYYEMMPGKAKGKDFCYVFMDYDRRFNIETACRAPHAAVRRYGRTENGYGPIFYDMDRDKWSECGLYDYIKGVEEGVSLLLGMDYNLVGTNGRRFSEDTLHYIISGKDKDITAFFGNIPHDSQNIERPYGPRLKANEIMQLFLIKGNERLKSNYNGEDLDWSIKRMNKTEMRLMELSQYLNLKRLQIFYSMRSVFRNRNSEIRLLLYTAGKAGQEMRQLLYFYPNITVVAWTDIRYDSKEFERLGLLPPREAFDTGFDLILIPMLETGKVFNEIREVVAAAYPQNKDKIIGKGEFFKMHGEAG